MTRTKALIGIGLLTVFLGSPARPMHAATPALPAAGTCQADHLTIAPYSGTAGVGHVGVEVRLHNRSAQACALVGFPTIVLLDVARRPLPTYLHWGPGYLAGHRPVRRVVLAPGGDAYAVVEWVHVPSPGQTCPIARFLLILPPGAATAQLVSMRGGVDACGGELTASPIEPTRFTGF